MKSASRADARSDASCLRALSNIRCAFVSFGLLFALSSASFFFPMSEMETPRTILAFVPELCKPGIESNLLRGTEK